MVKADGYGHGAREIARALAEEKCVVGFGVASLSEARDLALPDKPIWILGPALPEERSAIVEGGYIPVVSTLEEARAYSSSAEQLQKEARIQLAIDTGMGRVGCRPDNALNLLPELVALPGIVIESIGSHLPSADEDAAFTNDQFKQFRGLVREIRGAGYSFSHAHIANSAGTLGYPHREGETVRAGLMLYGSSPLPRWQKELRPALAWKSRVCLVRELPAGHGVSYGRIFITDRPTLTATISAGYADGLPRHLAASGAEVLIGGKRCPLLGRVTMDQIIVDVSHLPNPPEVGDETVIIGSQNSEIIPVDEVAERAGTITWEIFTGISKRVRREYRH